MIQETKYARNCPECGKILYYQNTSSLGHAIRKNATCRSCANKSRSKHITKKHSCPKCNVIIFHPTKQRFNNAVKNNSKCLDCRFKHPFAKNIKNNTKRCPDCNQYKPFEDFYKNKSTKSGLDYTCKVCGNIRRIYRKQNNINDYLANIIRIRVHNALKGRMKPASITKSLGCSVKELRVFLENQFYSNPITKEEMTWDNHKLFGWHIDHIKPLCSFDLADPKQFISACHFTNLQPLWVEDHKKKTAKNMKEKS